MDTTYTGNTIAPPRAKSVLRDSTKHNLPLENVSVPRKKRSKPRKETTTNSAAVAAASLPQKSEKKSKRV